MQKFEKCRNLRQTQVESIYYANSQLLNWEISYANQ